MEQELPLTPEMIDYAQSPVFRKGNRNVLSLLTFVLMLSFTAPAFLTAVTVLQHRPLGPGAAIVWILFGLFGTALFYLGLRGARLVRSDLASGVYIRWIGPFTTRVVNIGYRGSKGLVVEAGGRRLPPIGFYSGTVDYLPASNTLCEVRTEQGALLWSLFVRSELPGPAAPPAIVPQREVRYDFIDGAPMIATCREVRSAARHREAA